jgi:IS30 family transposase
MGDRYGQLTLEERCTIARLREAGQSCRQIAAALDRSPSSISRELRRNSGRQVGYRPAYAEEQTRARRWSGSRLERDVSLRDLVLDRLRAGWSPEQVAGRLAREAGHAVISHESIYRFIYAQIRRTNNGTWRHYLPRAKARRGWRRKRGGSPASFIAQRRPIGERPDEAEGRQRPGHWEADFMLFAAYGQSLLVAHERSSRLTLLARTPNRKAAVTAQALHRLLEPLPQPLRTTITFDNGTEFAQHHRLHRQLGVDTFFCDPHSPWQKGGVENAIGRLRRYLPRTTNLDQLTPKQLTRLARAYNHTPRKCLDFQTPAEAVSNHLLHFECESTSRPSPG